MTRRFLLALLPALALAILAAGALGVLNALPHQLAYATAGLVLAAALLRTPPLLRMLLVRLAPDASATALALGAGGVAAVATLLGFGAFALVSSALNDAWVRDAWTVWFPALPLLGALAGLGHFGYQELLRWLGAEAADAPGEADA